MFFREVWLVEKIDATSADGLQKEAPLYLSEYLA
jgi:hypothetical protein